MSSGLAIASLTFSVLSFLLIAVCTLLYVFPSFRDTLALGFAGLKSGGTSFSGIKMLAAFAGAFSPDITILMGFVSDIINTRFRYSATSIIAIICVILNWIIGGMIFGYSGSAVSTTAVVPDVVAATASTAATALPAVVGTVLGVGAPARAVRTRAQSMSSLGSSRVGTADPAGVSLVGPTGTRMSRMTGGAALPDYIQKRFNPCAIRGLGAFDISRSPMGIAALSSVFMVYILDMTVNSKRSAVESTVYGVFGGVVYLLNVFAYKEFGCYGGTYGSILRSTILPAIIGGVGGLSGFYVLNANFPTYLPLDDRSIGSPAMPSDGPKCNAPNDQDQFVCEAYKDGKRISSTTV
jgi:hypothetical protein